MKQCCIGIANVFAQRYYRTIFIFAEPPSNISSDAIFWIGMRCIDYDKLAEVKKSGIPSTVPITISTRIPIVYCPWCGVNLADYYHNIYNQLVDHKIIDEFNY